MTAPQSASRKPKQLDAGSFQPEILDTHTGALTLIPAQARAYPPEWIAVTCWVDSLGIADCAMSGRAGSQRPGRGDAELGRHLLSAGAPGLVRAPD
jgi:hypothetical protein